MICLVTGGAGFIGSHLCEALLDRGDSVLAFDDLSSGTLDNILPFYEHPNFRFIQGSILDKSTLSKAMEGCDEVYHLASVVGVEFVLRKPAHGISVNLVGTENVFDLATEHRCKVLFTSSSEVYGKDHTGKCSEDDSRTYGPPNKLRWTYASAKAMSEYSATARAKEHGLHIVVARLFNTVGPRQSGEYGMVLPRFIQQALAGTPLTVFGTGAQKRCFIWVGDAVQAIIALLRSEFIGGNIFNIGSEEAVSIAECARRIIRIAKSPSTISYVPYEAAYPDGFEEVMHRCPDISKLQRAIGFKPSLSFDEIIERIREHVAGKVPSGV
jgi:UDP-glucose 4-epimerase